MSWFTPALRVAILAAVASVTAASVVSTSATASSVNRRPICNDIGFNFPATLGASVQIPVQDVAADPDLTPVQLVSAFGGGPVGVASISNGNLVFTRTSTTRMTVYIYWTVSDGDLEAQCQAVGWAPPPSDG